MSELQAALEIHVELSKFYNVDLFQRGYYQVRTSLRTAPKAPVKVEVSLPRNSECNLVFPASIINGTAVSKTFQILYRSEDVTVNDVVVFKVYMLVDAQRIEARIEEADFVVDLELWFSDEEFGAESQNKLQCISTRSLKLHFTPTQGLHHHVPVLFDYFHLSVICVTVHATLLALHQPYINLSRQQPKSAWTSKSEQSTMEAVLFGANSNGALASSVSPRTQQACSMHRKLCHILLCAYESLQTSLQTIISKLPVYQKPTIDFMDCHAKLDELALRVQNNLTKGEDELFQTIQGDIAQLCAHNVILWSQYLDIVTFNERVTFFLSQQHHLQRVKKFAEVFFTHEYPKQEVIACYEPSVHGHGDLTTVIRNSSYFNNIPPLSVECTALDGDSNTTPVVFEDIYADSGSTRVFTSSELNLPADTAAPVSRSSSSNSSKKKKDRKSSVNSDPKDSRSDNSTASESSPRFKRSGKLSFIKNMRPESIKRPSAVLNPDVAAQVATDPTSCTLVGYRKTENISEKPAVQLGTLSTSGHMSLPTQSALYNAVSMPTLLAKGHVNMVSSGSLPELTSEKLDQFSEALDKIRQETQKSTETATKHEFGEESVNDQTACGDSVDDKTEDSTVLADACTAPDSSNSDQPDVTSDKEEDAECVKPNDCVTSKTKGESKSVEIECEDSLSPDSASPSVEEIGEAIENGYLPSSGYSENSSDVETPSLGTTKATDSSVYDLLAKNLTDALGESEHTEPCEQAISRTAGDNESVNSSENPKEAAATNNVETDQETVSANSSDQSKDDRSKDENRSDGDKTSSECKPAYISDGAVHKTTPFIDSGLSSQTSLLGSGALSSARSSRSDSLLVTEGALVNESQETAAADKRMKTSQSLGSVDDTYMSGQCTILELLKEDYDPKDEEGKAGEGIMRVSASTPELSALGDNNRKSLVSPVPDKTISFISAKETLRKQLAYQGHLYSDFVSQASTTPYFWPPEHLGQRSQDEGVHLIVCVHGLDGNSADLRLVKTYLELALPGEKVDFLMSERNQQDTFADFETMTDRLVGEINYHIEMFGFSPARLSFVGHSLGNLIIRSALSRQDMAPLLPKLYTFLSLSGPHLGTMYNSSGLVNMGMWIMQKWKKSGSLQQLALKDHVDPRQTFLYKLSQKTGLEFFRNILLVGSQQDRYVPYHSSRIELCRQAVRDSSSMGAVYAEMVSNILQPVIYSNDVNIIRYDVFHALPSNANTMIGRAAHIAVLDSELFIEKFISVSALKYFK